MHQGPQFLNVDLEIWSRTDLSSIAMALSPRALVLHAGKVRRKFLVSVEVAKTTTSPERTMWALLRLVESLPPVARRRWKGADARIFNVGYEGGRPVLLHERPAGSGRWYARRRSDAAPYETSFSPELLRAVARVGGTITTTIYPLTEQVRPRRRTRRQPRGGGTP